MYMEITNVQNSRRSVFITHEMEFQPTTKDDYFTTRYLERP